jgi:hypothetical protein
MTTATMTHGNQTKVAQVERAWSEVLATALKRGFFGSVSLEVVIQDGTIQTLRRRIEQQER